jgi:DNA polymerase III alpha subunit
LHTQALEHSGTQALKQLAALEPWDDPNVWEMIASGGARAVHHIESPAMVSLCRMCNVRDIDGLIAIVSVIRPGAANECKKMTFTRRYQGLEPVIYPHPSLEPCLKSTFGMIVYEEHILQICEAFAGLTPGRADVLRRALVKQNHKMIEEIGGDFFRCARERGRSEMDIANVWRLVCAFQGYAFCKAHSTAYGVEAYQSAWLKRYYPAEFMAAVLSNGKGFYQPLVYVLECHRLGIPLLPPWINQPGPLFTVVRRDELLTAGADAREEERQRNPAHDIEAVAPAAMNPAIRVPAIRVKGLSERVCERIVTERKRGEFVSPGEFYHRVAPSHEEMELLLKAGAFDGFGKSRTALFWEIQHLCRAFRGECEPNQGWLLSSPAGDCVPDVSLTEPTRLQRLRWESELLDFAASGHPLELYSDIAWDTYCHVADLGKHLGETVVCCGLIIEDRIHEQTSGEPMKFLTLSDWTGMVETELFAKTYKSYGLATVRYPVLEITATVEPYENGRGFSLRVHHAGKPRSAQAQGGTEGG